MLGDRLFLKSSTLQRADVGHCRHLGSDNSSLEGSGRWGDISANMNRVSSFRVTISLCCLAACSKDQAPNAPLLNPPQLPAYSTFRVNLPSNAPAQVRSYYANVDLPLSIALRHYLNVKNVGPKNSGVTWTWTYTPTGVSGVEITLKAVELAGDSSAWTVSWRGTIGQITLNNWISDDGKVTADGKYGAWKFYLLNDTFLIGNAIWLKDAQNVVRINAARFRDLDPNDEEPGYYIHIKLVGNADASGSLKATEKGVTTIEAIWDTSGGGSWVSYDPSSGQPTGGGSWNP